MLKLKIDEISVLLGRQNDTDCKIRHVCSRCKRKRYVKFFKIADCGKCLICRNISRCKLKDFKIVEKL